MTTVLVVDDLLPQRQLAAGLLAKQGDYEVVFARDGKEALARLAGQPADLVLTDIVMPEMDGVELLQAVRRDYPHVPVILMTASGSEQLAVQALREGAASYVPKRVLAYRLGDTVRSVLAAARAERTHVELQRRLVSQEFAFRLENDDELLLSVPAYLKPYLVAAGLTDRAALLRTHMALEEALVNALYHGNLEVGAVLREKDPAALYQLAARRAKEEPYQERKIHVRVRLTADQAEFSVRDEGPGFDPTTLPPPTDVTSLDGQGGRGVLLMRTFMDEVRYDATGNEVTMSKRLHPASAGQGVP
jgi:CheY-like chemotaxis protein/anti-sigma regulatory factor (Ser/Thr protein kinase)